MAWCGTGSSAWWLFLRLERFHLRTNRLLKTLPMCRLLMATRLPTSLLQLSLPPMSRQQFHQPCCRPRLRHQRTRQR